MATRQRTSSSGKKKPAASPALVSQAADDGNTSFDPPTNGIDEPAQESRSATRESREPVVEITRLTLEHREIPSFSENREARIAEAAYWRAERRGFQPGHELDDWLAAEKYVDDGDPRTRT